MILSKHEVNRGIHRHETWTFTENGRWLQICRDHGVFGASFYISSTGTGEGCNTIWYPTFEAAKAEVERLFKTGGKVVTGRDAKLCRDCKCHMSPFTKSGRQSKRYQNAKEFLCSEFKKKKGGEQ